jgi:hypothetical protein
MAPRGRLGAAVGRVIAGWITQGSAFRATCALASRVQDHETMSTLSDSCRYAALAFLNGTIGGWGKRELGAWLAGPYADVTQPARISDFPPTSDAGAARPPASASGSRRELAPYAVSRVMREAHDEAIEVLRQLAEPEGGVAFAFGAVDTLVEHTFDGSTEHEASWVPLAPTRMRLADRVLSLLAVDYLSRPEDYESALFICGRCTLVGFDAAARARGLCRVHSVSGIRFKSDAPPAMPSRAADAEEVAIAALVAIGRRARQAC